MSLIIGVCLSLLARCLSQSCECGLVIENRLVQSVALFDEGCLRVSDFNDLRFARAITRNRSGHVVLRLDHAIARDADTCGGGFGLSAGGIKLLGEAAQCDRSFVFREIDSELRLALATASRAPIEDRDRKTDLTRNAAVLFQTRLFQRVSLEASVNRVGKGRQTIGASDTDLLARSA